MVRSLGSLTPAEQHGTSEAGEIPALSRNGGS